MPIITTITTLGEAPLLWNPRLSITMQNLLHVGYCNPELKHSRLFNLSVDLPRSEHSDRTSIDDVSGRILTLRNLNKSRAVVFRALEENF